MKPSILDAMRKIVGDTYVLTENRDIEHYCTDWTAKYTGVARAVVKPANSSEIAQIIMVCNQHNVSVVPQGGNTGVCGGATPLGELQSVVVSLERLRKIRRVNSVARTAVVEAGVVLQTLQNFVTEQDLSFPLMFGARGSAQIGGCLSTNAGGSNVLRYGSARDLCLGIEAVLPDGSIINNLSGLRKDNTGYDLKNLLIGAEGTLGIITAATVKLFPVPKIRWTAFLSLASLDVALPVLNALQDRCGGLVEAFEFMPQRMVEVVCAHVAGTKPPLTEPASVGILVEIASTREDDARVLPDGSIALESRLLETLDSMFENGTLLDANIVQTEQQRTDLWHLRESVLEAILAHGPCYGTDISLPLENVPRFVDEMDSCMEKNNLIPLTVGHLGDGNLHYTIASVAGDPAKNPAFDHVIRELFDLLTKLEGSFSAEHGIGQSKLDLFSKLKEPSQISVMKRIKRALDPDNIMNPGKLLAGP